MEVLYDIDRSRLKQFCSCFYNFMFELQLYTFIYTLYAHTHSLLLLLFSYIGSLVFFLVLSLRARLQLYHIFWFRTSRTMAMKRCEALIEKRKKKPRFSSISLTV